MSRQRMAEVSTAKTYVAVYNRDDTDDAWNVRIKGVDGCQTYGRSLRQAQQRIREALAVWLDAEPATLAIRDQLPEQFTAVTARVNRSRSAAERATAEAQEQTAQAARTLSELGLSRRDAAELLGLSHQRVQQLLESS
jgi:predicted RNase H-like HicB family nuclease